MKTVEDTRDEILEAVADALDAGERDAGDGGIHSTTVAERMPLSISQTQEHLATLADHGDLVPVWGFGGDNPGPRQSYLPADHPDVAEDDEEVRRVI